MSVYKRGKKGTHWHYYFRVRGVRYRGSIPEARTKWEAEKAESKIKQDIFEGRFGKIETGTMKLKDFIDDIYMPWAKANKKSWLNDHYNKVILKDYFGNKQLREIQPLEIERFKSKRLATETKFKTERAPASVNREFEMLSRIFTLAISLGKADSNPCVRVKKFKLDNERYRYLAPDEEAALMEKLIDKRVHLHAMVIVALGTGLRKREQLNLRRDQVDFFRNVVIASRTKGKRNREVPMNVLDERVKPILMRLCGKKRADEFVFVNPDTKKPYTDIKRSFATACDKAKIRDLEWHDLRATFCTRLALTGYDAFTIKAIMGHRDMKTTERYIRANRITKEVGFVRSVHKLATNDERPQNAAAVSA
ncbi:MAG TPA: site-specific integrase [Pyrinomonadaceae bacterium]|nr:site-specific integrase [Pyrinomonadaceae bacterium]